MTVSRIFGQVIVALAGVAAAASAFSAPGVALVRDTNDAVVSRSSTPNNFRRLDDRAVFATTDGNAWELWRSDGTTAGTAVVRSDAGVFRTPIGDELDGRVLLQVGDTNNQRFIASTDGTSAGTQSLFQVSTQQQTGEYSLLGQTAAHRELIWSMVPQGGWRIWTTDGTPAGTTSIAVDVRVANWESNAGITPPTVRGNTAFFQGQSPTTGVWEVWRTDGTAANTARIVDTDPETGSGGDQFLGADDTFVYFMAENDGTTGNEIWRYEIATGHTQLLLDFAPGVGDNNVSWLEPVPGGVVFLNDGVLYFATTAGTGLVQLAAFNDQPTVVGRVTNRVLFRGRGVPDDGQELWSTDGTPAGTGRVRDYSPGNEDTNVYAGPMLSADRMLIVIVAADSQLWSTDGTPAGTRRMVASTTVNFGADPVFVVANEGTGTHTRLWKIDRATEAATSIQSPGYYGELLALGQNVLFAGSDADHGVEPWVSDGTTAGTHLLADVEGQNSNDTGLVDKLTTVGGIAMFEAWDAGHSYELWKTDGTAAGTTRVTDVGPDLIYSTVNHPQAAGGQLFFQDFYVNSPTMWRSDGTAAGTVPVLDGNQTRFNFEQPGNLGECTHWVAALGSLTLFGTNTTADHWQLWATDGTTAGTRIVDAAAHPAGTQAICDLTTIGSLVYYRASLNALPQLFRSDGTEAGTFALTDETTSHGWADPPVAVGTRAYFLIDDNGTRLWSTDGSVSGTRPFTAGGNAAGLPVLSIVGVLGGKLVVQLFDGGVVASLDVTTGALTNLMSPGTAATGGVVTGGRLFFACADVCVTDGTAAGTSRVREAEPGVQRSGPLLAYNGGAYFVSNVPSSFGRELWKTDGTSGGTVRLAAPTDTNPVITQPAIAGGRVVFGMSDASIGQELWRVTSAAPVAAADSATLTKGTNALIAVLANDTDSDGRLVMDGLTITTAPGGGTATIEAGGVRYTPRADFTGSDSFRYRITDDSGESAEATVSVQVTDPSSSSSGGGGGGGGRIEAFMLVLLMLLAARRVLPNGERRD